MVTDMLMGLKYTATIAQVASKVPLYKRLYNGILPRKKILVVGESGSGKTQFINVLKLVGGTVKKSTMNVTIVTVSLPNGRKVDFVDTPGQQTLQDQRQRAINDISRNKYDGIINIVCYGYQVNDSTKESDVFQVGSSNVKASYLENNRQLELKQVKEWLPRIDNIKKLEWVLTIVNKADIWYEVKDEVMAYYNSSYHDQMVKIGQFIQTPTIPYCCVISPFFKRKMSIIMGEDEKLQMHLELYEVLGNLLHIAWK